MIRIILVCQSGASTGILEKKILQAAKEQNIDVKVEAYPDSKLAEVIDQADIILLAPQVGFKKDKICKQFEDRKVVIGTINAVDYGMLDGSKILNYALKLYEEK